MKRCYVFKHQSMIYRALWATHYRFCKPFMWAST